MSPTTPTAPFGGSTSARLMTSSVRWPTCAADLAARYKAFEGLRKARAASAAAVRLFEGPNRYLLVASNNAEMRAGSGTFLSAAELVVRDGRLRLGAVNPTDLVLPERTVPVRGDLDTNGGRLDPANDFRNLGLTPDFPTSAAQATRMWPHTPGGREAKGVIAVDVRGLAGLLKVTGPVDVDGVTYQRGLDRVAAAAGAVRRVRHVLCTT